MSGTSASDVPANRPPRDVTRSPAELKQLIELERSGAPFLVWRDVDSTQQVRSLADCTSLTVGRSPESDLVLSDDEASRTHAELRRIGADWTVEDDGLSRNGTFVNEVRTTQRRRLADRDVMRFGQTRVEFRAPQMVSSDITRVGTESVATDSLSETQRRILIALCRPYKSGAAFASPASNNQIAAEVFLGVDAVKNHLRLLYQRFAIADLPQNQKRAQLAERALQLGFGAEDSS
jgi:predicted component of type VI protein secretion system